jgi:dephospho-CoA kinase
MLGAQSLNLAVPPLDVLEKLMLKIGIAGGIGAGKSFVSQIFVSWGARVIDADQWGHRVLELPAVKSALIAEWGPGILNQRGNDRPQ